MTEGAPRKESAGEKKAREEVEQQELNGRRKRQLAEAQKAEDILEDKLEAARSTVNRCNALLGHSKGFYEEINKLTRGKALVGVTDLVREQANDVIRDAKTIVKDDVYLDRIKEFVFAGDNPVYPDVLVSIRSVRESLGRAMVSLNGQVEKAAELLRRARTVIGALEYFLDEDEDNEDDKNTPGKETVNLYTTGAVSEFCFSTDANTYEMYFDFDRLDRGSIDEYLSLTATDQTGDDEGNEEGAPEDGETIEEDKDLEQ